ncbi:glycoside hydrolase family 2 TIM barrel-domain containing protein [Paenibacillus sp. P13VS]|uniref:glycoside hydrolase family 2 TIM barrel-domain containing protein n=1 Tax=Paenibacillus sp. P13VS TaxID=2697367 RepID=UPI00187BA7F1|nr:glycoside hydrolase family 2 TIM barrel-domain containing protein [Paenibacillus sp. P13VS]MBE7683941.1 beta-glucuronidase [Paenibacillus sp. P13VS]
MLPIINLQGVWRMQLDENKLGINTPYDDTITMPNTTSHARKGKRNELAEVGALTDEYAFEGWLWLEREFEVPEELEGKYCCLHLERTRVTTVWVDDIPLGTRNSLNTPHEYVLKEGLSAGTHTVRIKVDNTSYPTKGGHMTSKDTQTNWNGITGKLELKFSNEARMRDVQIYTDAMHKSITLSVKLDGELQNTQIAVSAQSFAIDEQTSGLEEAVHEVGERLYPVDHNEMSISYALGDKALLWSDDAPHLYTIAITLREESGRIIDDRDIVIGLRDFKASGDKFTINNRPTFLRGKHDGLIFPLTGYAPTDVNEWVRILSISKSYGINHYRFHTCCPPEAAFAAADMLGIYMEPELPFWGTITDESDANHNQAEQDYLIEEGFAILRSFGNHPSFVMMSLGNELWGSKEKLSAILKDYKAYDQRHLYTQGSNNFQFTPVILEEEDFFSGVRFSRDRLIRGSYAMCDAPLGHVQTDLPGTMKDYDEHIHPQQHTGLEDSHLQEQEIQIQYGTVSKTVKAAATDKELIPHLPVVSHEIGQYAMYPDFAEIEKYTGSIKAHNFEIFRERLQAKGMGHLAESFFRASGQLAVDCYKEELEAAFRSERLAGFQLLDLQDFSGQGTALVGILDAFMDSKGLISAEDWRTFCSDAVLLARFEKYNYAARETFNASVELSYYRQFPLKGETLRWECTLGDRVISEGEQLITEDHMKPYQKLGNIHVTLPNVDNMSQVSFKLSISNTDIYKSYNIWVYPEQADRQFADAPVFKELTDAALQRLEEGGSVLLLASPGQVTNAIEGLYSTDFWCYPMFRSISESMNKPVPVGTLGLLIQNDHPALQHFPSEMHSTYPWWNIVTHSSSIILDDLASDLQPIVQTIDNFERNHKLGLLFECKVGKGKVLVGSLDFAQLLSQIEGRQFIHSLLQYIESEDFEPTHEMTVHAMNQLLFK